LFFVGIEQIFVEIRTLKLALDNSHIRQLWKDGPWESAFSVEIDHGDRRESRYFPLDSLNRSYATRTEAAERNLERFKEWLLASLGPGK
jgi:hypothetical protein